MSRQDVNWWACMIFALALMIIGDTTAGMAFVAASFVILSLPKDPPK